MPAVFFLISVLLFFIWEGNRGGRGVKIMWLISDEILPCVLNLKNMNIPFAENVGEKKNTCAFFVVTHTLLCCIIWNKSMCLNEFSSWIFQINRTVTEKLLSLFKFIFGVGSYCAQFCSTFSVSFQGFTCIKTLTNECVGISFLSTTFVP